MMRMTDPLTAVELPEGGALCAVSGGLDSMCLLEMTVRQGQKQGRRVAAAHFNHQLRGAEADRDEAFVRDWCAAREIPFFAGRGDVRAFAEKTGRTVEEAARQLRYEFLEETRRREGFGCILTAHHADDSAETMLLNLLRGTGLKGLTGIPEKRDCILRPLLSVTRAELAAYAAEHRIPFVEDSTNGTDDAARNMLRHQVLPVLKKLNPRVVENMSRTASLLTADKAALDAACRKLLAQCAVTPNVSGMIPLAVLQDAPEALRGRLVLAVLAAVGAAVALAIKDNLSNLASGLVLLFTKPFKAGDFIEVDGSSGTIREIELMHTYLDTVGNTRLAIPNTKMMTATINNYSVYDTRRQDFVFSISYDDDLIKAEELLRGMVDRHPMVLQDPPPMVKVKEHAASSVNLLVRVWCKSEDYWDLQFDLLEQVKLAFDENGLSIPFQQLDVHLPAPAKTE